MLILAISTSSKICSVALLEDEDLIQELNIENQKTHSENLLPLIDKLFKNNNKNIKDVNLIACDIGPGSFTGIRIGISTVKALAEVNNLPIISCTSLEILSYNFNATDINNICSLIDARNNQVYCGMFDNNHQLIGNYIADDIKNVLNVLSSDKKLEFVGDGAKLHESILPGEVLKDTDIHASNLGICAFNKYKSGAFETADSVLPLYLRPSQAERMRNLK